MALFLPARRVSESRGCFTQLREILQEESKRERETVMRKGVGQQRFHRDLSEGSNDVTVADLNEAFLERSCAFRTCVDVPTPGLSSTLL